MPDLVALSIASEIFPLVKTGGLADIAGALPLALAQENVAVSTLVPGYPAVLDALAGAEPVAEFADLLGGPARILRGKAGELDLFALNAPHLYLRPGGPYIGADGIDHPDNAQRFAALSQAGAALSQGLAANFTPDIVHGHDWQAGLTAAYLRFSGKRAPPFVFTIHNLAFQGVFRAGLLAPLGLPATSFVTGGLEFYDQISFLKAGINFSDAITTVSPTYAREILQPDQGMSFDGILRAREEVLYGIRNGIDTQVWNPAADPLIAKNFSNRKLAARAENTHALRRKTGLAEIDGALLLGVVSRLSSQKGLDLVLECLPLFEPLNLQLVLLGAGDPELEEAFAEAAAAAPERIAAHFGYSEGLAHLIQAGAHVLLAPSRFEPCGLTQLCALRYGAVPLTSRVGGFADTIIDANDMALSAGCATGLQFTPVAADALAAALRKAAGIFANPALWRQIQLNGMKSDVGWTQPARTYANLFRKIAA
ncbi:glycogen synthase GlgA [uncultured Rhodoblastus sp.]|uniref:glycogen synthase GlgA n=1 Tax=uncultured Rhodoblastus sp. TaxID=543037 RepID=UPI0025D0F80E|nr:glycogen synthase GlgA [uncultured Rhodoblastus sp.]